MDKRIENIIRVINEVKIRYDSNLNSKGRQAEECIEKSLKRYRKAYDITAFRAGSYADVDLKIDIMAQIKEIGWVLFQIKYKEGIKSTMPLEDENVNIKDIYTAKDINEKLNNPKKIRIEIHTDPIPEYYTEESMDEIVKDIKAGHTLITIYDNYYISNVTREEKEKEQQEERKKNEDSIFNYVSFKRGDIEGNKIRWEKAKKKYEAAMKKKYGDNYRIDEDEEDKNE